MKVSIGANVCLNNQDYRPGDLADLPDDLVESWFFQALVKEEKIHVVEYVGPEFKESPAPISEASKRVHIPEPVLENSSVEESSPKEESPSMEVQESVESPAPATNKKRRGKK